MIDPQLDKLIRWRRWISRYMLAALLLGLILIATSYGMMWIKQSQNRDFHRRVVAPALERLRDDRSNPEEVDHALQNLLDRRQSLLLWLELRYIGILVFGGGGVFGTIVMMALDRAINQRLARPDRPAAPGTGEVTREFARIGKPVIATAPPLVPRSRRWIWLIGGPVVFAVFLLLQLYLELPWMTSFLLLGFVVFVGGILFLAGAARTGGGRQSIEVDPTTRRIVFRHFRFVSHFVRNPVRPECTLRASDILNVEPLADNQGRAVTVRTTQGRVGIFDRLQNFVPVVNLLADFAESNRLDPAAFRSSLEHEPRLKTPWWGWILLIGLIASVVGGLWWLLTRLG